MTRSATIVSSRLPAVVRSARPRQWIKNALVLAAPAAAGVLDQGRALLDVMLAVAAFCLASSAVYLLNDARDAPADRLHPTKQRRPVAAGELTPGTARRWSVLLALAALGVTLAVRWELTTAVAGYLAVAAAYSSLGKGVPYLELALIASGFWLRAFGGAVAVDVPISAWFGLVVAAGAVFAVSGKRLAETHNLGSASPTRPVLARYRPARLAAAQMAAGLGAVAGYVAWVVADRPDGVGAVPSALAVVPLAVALGRYAALNRTGRGEEPEDVLLRDPVALAAVLAWCCLYGVAVYG